MIVKELKIMWKYYLASFLIGFSTLTGGYMFLYFNQNLNLSFSVINLALVVFILTDIIFELPTGAIGDVLGRKWQAILGMLIMTVGAFGLYYTVFSWHLMISYAIIGIGWAFLYGAREAWMVDNLKKLKLKNLVHIFFAHAKTAFLIGAIFGPFVASYLVLRFSMRSLFFADALVGALAIFPMILEHEYFTPQKKSSWLKIIKKTYRHFLEHKHCRLLLLVFFFTAIPIGVVAGYQPFLSKLGAPLIIFGIQSGIAGLFGALALLFSKWLNGFAKSTLIAVSLLQVAFAIPLLFLIEGQWVLGATLILLPAILTIAEPFVFVYQNVLVPSSIRSSALSVFGLATSAGNGVGYLIGGPALDALGPPKAIVLFSLSFIVVAIIYASLPSLSKRWS